VGKNARRLPGQAVKSMKETSAALFLLDDRVSEQQQSIAKTG
jgi:hypothetical protein